MLRSWRRLSSLRVRGTFQSRVSPPRQKPVHVPKCIQFWRSRLSINSKNEIGVMKARPHPGPLPRGRGEAVSASWQDDGGRIRRWFMGREQGRMAYTTLPCASCVPLAGRLESAPDVEFVQSQSAAAPGRGNHPRPGADSGRGGHGQDPRHHLPHRAHRRARALRRATSSPSPSPTRPPARCGSASPSC